MPTTPPKLYLVTAWTAQDEEADTKNMVLMKDEPIFASTAEGAKRQAVLEIKNMPPAGIEHVKLHIQELSPQ